MTPEQKQKLDQRLAYWENPFAFVEPDVCIVTFFSPGFSFDLSSWELRLSVSGILVQDIELLSAPQWQKEQRREEREVGAEFVEQVLNRADEIDFWNLQVEREGGVTDMPSYRLAIRKSEKSRVYGPDAVSYHAYQGDESARRFVELWKLIHLHAPFS